MSVICVPTPKEKLIMKKQTITFTAIILTLGCFAFLPRTQAVSPPPDGCYPGFTTAEGCSALQNLTSGAGNTGVGWRSLFSNSTGSFNTAVGAGTLLANTGSNNTAFGAAALLSNTTGSNNTALGASAGTDPGIGSNNVYIGDPGFAGDENVLSIGGIAASGIDYQMTFIGGIYGADVNTGTALPVYVDTDGHLGTNLINDGSAKLRIRAPKGGHPQAKVNEFQKQQKRIAELEGTVARLVATVKEQAAQIEKVSAQLEQSASQLITLKQ
jgi:hypothetical protein